MLSPSAEPEGECADSLGEFAWRWLNDEDPLKGFPPRVCS